MGGLKKKYVAQDFGDTFICRRMRVKARKILKAGITPLAFLARRDIGIFHKFYMVIITIEKINGSTAVFLRKEAFEKVQGFEDSWNSYIPSIGYPTISPNERRKVSALLKKYVLANMEQEMPDTPYKELFETDPARHKLGRPPSETNLTKMTYCLHEKHLAFVEEESHRPGGKLSLSATMRSLLSELESIRLKSKQRKDKGDE